MLRDSEALTQGDLEDPGKALQASAAAVRATQQPTQQLPLAAPRRSPQPQGSLLPRQPAPLPSQSPPLIDVANKRTVLGPGQQYAPPPRVLMQHPAQQVPPQPVAVPIHPQPMPGLRLTTAQNASTSVVAKASMAVDGADQAGPFGALRKYKRAWSIQEALDQHSTLCQQKFDLTKMSTNIVRTSRTKIDFARMEVEDALQRTRSLAPVEAVDASRIRALAAHIRRACHDFALAQRIRTLDAAFLQEQLQVAEEEIEKSRQEMKALKAAIDDKSLTVATDDLPPDPDPNREFRYCCNCKVGGHGQRFCEYLLKRPNWRVYPHQKWFEDEKHNEYHCPLGKRLVDFADESHFSRLAMYIKGRIWLEDKTKMWHLVPDLMPKTYIIEDQKWKDDIVPEDEPGVVLPWFVKEADRNWGTSVNVCARASDCMVYASPGATYVVQQHIKDPLCMEDGRKCHIKFYVLLMALEDGKTWRLYTFKDGYLSISPNKWSPKDLSKDTQVTIIRSERIGGWEPWKDAYPKCKAGVAEVIRRGVAQGKLEGRLGKRQFEILSSDFIVDTNGDVWLFEFNMSPVLKDPQDSPQTNDADMITAGLDIVVPWEHSEEGNWDFAGEFVGEAPLPKPPQLEEQQQQLRQQQQVRQPLRTIDGIQSDLGTATVRPRQGQGELDESGADGCF